MTVPAVIYHVATVKQARQYQRSGCIKAPVRGFETDRAAMSWAMRIGRKVVYRVEVNGGPVHKLPDHTSQFGDAWWIDADVPSEDYRCHVSSERW